MVDLANELEKYAFPVEGVDDESIAEALHLTQPLETITLKAPQLLVHHYGLSHFRFVMSFDKGMGKTIAYLSTLYTDALAKGKPFKVLLVCSENAKLAQRREIERHLHEHFKRWTFVEGTKPKRRSIWNSDCDVFICTYDSLQADMGLRTSGSAERICPKWVDQPETAMAFDEWHKKLRNKSSGCFKMLKKFQNKRMIFSSGSAGGKGAHSIWAVLHLCNPIKFPAYWPYVMRHCFIEETSFGKKISGCVDVPRWRKEVSTNIFHRRKDSKDYPPKTRQALEVRMEPWQKKAHDQLQKELMLVLPDGGFFASPNVLAATSKLRQFMICPKVISPEYGWGACLEGALADAQESELTHWVISTPFKEPIPWMQQFLAEHNIHSEVLTGGLGLKANEIEERIELWTRRGGVMIQTIQFAESYELPAARHMYMLGYLHDPEQNAQAEDRIHRDIRVTPDPVDIYYVKALKSYDENIIEAMSNSADNVHALMHRPIQEFIQDV